jgi:hypothetical protein
VLVRKRISSTGSWSNERALSLPGESGRNPHLAHDGVRSWVAYEVVDQGTGCSIRAGVITDEPDPIDCHTLATTTYNGPLDLLVHTSAGRVWVTWVDGLTTVGWSRYDQSSGLWTPANYEPSVDSVQAARNRIEVKVFAN